MKKFPCIPIFFCLASTISTLLVSVSGNDLEGYHLCGDASCQIVVAEGRTTGKYISGANGLLSFKTGQDVLIYSKEGRGNKNYWSVEIQGKRGFAPKNFISITREIIRDLKFEVPLSGKYVVAQEPPPQEVPRQQPSATAQNVDKNVVVEPASQPHLADNHNTEVPEVVTTTFTSSNKETPKEETIQPPVTKTNENIPSDSSAHPDHVPHASSSSPMSSEQVKDNTASSSEPSSLHSEQAKEDTAAPPSTHSPPPIVEITPSSHQTPPEPVATPEEASQKEFVEQSTTPVPTTEKVQEESLKMHEPQLDVNESKDVIQNPVAADNEPQAQAQIDPMAAATPAPNMEHSEIHNPVSSENLPTSPEVAPTINQNSNINMQNSPQSEEIHDQNSRIEDPELIKPQEMNPSLAMDVTQDQVEENEENKTTTTSGEEIPLTDFDKDDFYKNADEDYEDEEPEKEVDSESQKNLVNQVIEEFNAESNNVPPASQENDGSQPSFQFLYGNQYKTEESESPENNENNHVDQASSSQNNDEMQHYGYMGGNVHLPQGSEEANESVGQSSSPDIDNGSSIFKEPSGDSSEEETMNLFDRIIQDIYPSWVHDVIHVNGLEEVSPEYCLCMVVSASTICIIYFIKFVMEKTSRESPLKAHVALLDKQLFQCKNDNLIIKKQLETNSNTATNVTTKTVVKQETPSHILAELEQLKEEREKLLNDSYNYQLVVQEKSALEDEKEKFKSLYEQSQQELLEAETIVQECLEEKKQAKASSSNNDDMLRALQTLEDQLNSQKQAVLKYESKVKKRDSELKEKIQELRKLRADAANAKLEVDKVGAEKEGLVKRIQALEGIDKERESELDNLRQVEKELKALKVKLGDLKEDVETKESELEAKNTEIEVLNHTIGTLKCIASATESENQSSDGWDFQDTPSIDVVEELSRCKVDLQKASDACNNLSEQLTKVETERDELNSTLEKQKEEWEVALKVKEQVLNEKVELEHKHNVLSNYFNQREAELQKQLGLQSARLNEAEQGSESSSKKMVSVCEELESYKSQLKTLKLEMEEMERSWKSQNASLEKKQHESWVTVRQEARRNAEAQNEMQTLRSRLTVTEAKILEKDAEIKRVSEENNALRETIQNISTSQPINNILKPEPIYPNGHSLSALPNSNGKSSGTPSVSSIEPPPPELPPLPFLPPPPMLPMMPLLPHNQSIMDTHRPAPVGRRSPTRGGNGGRYSRSPSPGYYNNRSNIFRDSSPGSRSDRSRFDYSPSPPYRRHSSRERSPDRFSTRSDRSDLSHHHHHSSRHRGDTSYRDTPPRDSRHHYHRRSSNEFPGSGLDDDEEYHRSKRSSNRTRNNNKNSRNKNNGPKTSSPMIDGRDLNI